MNLFNPRTRKPFTSGAIGGKFRYVTAKSVTSRRKLNNIPKANRSTPKRAIFVCSERTPKENALSVLLSMVGRKGQPLAVGCFPLVAVSYPFTLYRQAVGSKAESLKPKDTVMTNKNHLNPIYDENLSHTNPFTTDAKTVYSVPAFAKSKAERQNSTNEQLADNSTPLNRAFFIRSTSTPKESGYNAVILSMVACSGKGFALCCVPIVAVSDPVTSYRQAVRSEAIAPINEQLELSQMKAFLFLCVNRTATPYQEKTVRIVADSEENARFQLSADYRLVLARPIAVP